MKKMIQRKVETMIKSGESIAGLLHKITKPTLWRGGAKRKEWAKHWQSDESVQNVDKPSGLCKAKKQEWDATDSTRTFPCT